MIKCLVKFNFFFALLLGMSCSIGNAQTTISTGWAGANGQVSLITNISGSPAAGGTGVTGYFGVSFDDSTMTGFVTSINNSKDSAGTYYSNLIALGYFYPVINGVKGPQKIAKATFFLKKFADGSSEEAILIREYYTGAILQSIGVSETGLVMRVPLVRGSNYIYLRN